jgi:hypothetical protein
MALASGPSRIRGQLESFLDQCGRGSLREVHAGLGPWVVVGDTGLTATERAAQAAERQHPD